MNDMNSAYDLVLKMKAAGYDVTITEQPGWETGCRVAPRGEFNTLNVIFETGDTAISAIQNSFEKLIKTLLPWMCPEHPKELVKNLYNLHFCSICGRQLAEVYSPLEEEK
jgi:hypothetical protein